MKILVSLLSPPVVAEFVKGSKPGPGHRTVFSDGVAYNKPLAGSHSGFVTTLRIAKANDRLYQKGSYLFQYEGVYRFNAVPNTPLMRGQVTARGVLYGTLDSKGNFTPLDGPIKVAITGGTDAYVTAHGEITERQPKLENRLLDISL
jgi:hypothetical protein